MRGTGRAGGFAATEAAGLFGAVGTIGSVALTLTLSTASTGATAATALAVSAARVDGVAAIGAAVAGALVLVAGLAGFAFALGDVVIGTGGDGVVESFGLFADEAAVDETFEGLEGAVVFFGDETDGVADGLGAAGAADAVDVVLGGFGEVVVDDVGDAVDVDAAGGDVGGDEHPNGAAFEVGKGAKALVLGAVGVKGGGFDAVAVEVAGDAVGPVLHFGEDEDGVEGGVDEEVEEKGGFEVLGDLVDELGDAFGGVGAFANLDGFGSLLKFVGEGFDLAAEGGGEHKGLTPGGEGFDDALDGGEETHVEHAVGFVEDEAFEIAEVAVALAHEVDETAGGGDDDVGSVAQGLDLGAFADAAEDHGDAQGEVFGVGVDVVFDLGDEFAGGGEDEGFGAAHAALALKAGEVGEDGQGEGGGFAGAGLGDADEVLSGEDLRDGSGLDGGGFSVAGFLDGLENAGV